MKKHLLKLGGEAQGGLKRSLVVGEKLVRAAKVGRKVQAGFTLIELLIVILVMSILTVIAVGSYAGVQRQARIDFAADTLVAAFREESLLAKSGRTAGGGAGGGGAAVAGKLQCFALKIGKGVKGGLWSAPTDYIGIPTQLPGEPVVSGKIDTCAPIGDDNLWQKRDIFDGDIIIKSITAAGAGGEATPAVDPQVFYFKPPFGQLYLENAGLLGAQRDGVFDYIVGVLDQPGFDRKVEYDVSTGEAKKVSYAAPAV